VFTSCRAKRSKRSSFGTNRRVVPLIFAFSTVVARCSVAEATHYRAAFPSEGSRRLSSNEWLDPGIWVAVGEVFEMLSAPILGKWRWPWHSSAVVQVVHRLRHLEGEAIMKGGGSCFGEVRDSERVGLWRYGFTVWILVNPFLVTRSCNVNASNCITISFTAPGPYFVRCHLSQTFSQPLGTPSDHSPVKSHSALECTLASMIYKRVWAAHSNIPRYSVADAHR